MSERDELREIAAGLKQHAELLDRELEHGPYVSLADVVERT